MSRPDITVYAHESPRKFCRLPQQSIREGTVQNLFELFESSRWISKANLEKRTIELRFVFNQDLIASILISVLQTTLMVVIQFPKANDDENGTDFVATRTSKRKSLACAFGQPQPQVRRVLHSAFRPASILSKRFTREPPLKKYIFERKIGHVSSDGRVKFIKSTSLEEIQLATDVRTTDMKMDRQAEGFIGDGYSKVVIYVR